MKRLLQPYILKDLPSKIVLLSGPRQCGKTTLAKQLQANFDYFNYDAVKDRLMLNEQSWDRSKQLIIFDELHKMPQWKRWLKGIYDTEGIPPSMLVTGSARLNTYRKVGDSLAGRYFQYHLHPLDLKEALQVWQNKPIEVFNALWSCSGFPEPLLKGSEIFYKRWRRSHLDIILRQDLVDLYAARDIQAIETLVALLRRRVGSTVSYANLARDLERDAMTIKRWLQLLENLYVIFRVTPYHRNIARSLLKEPKYYFYDHLQTEQGNGERLENIVACALLKELDFITDTTGNKTTLHFLRTKEGKEIDFLVCIEGQPTQLIEVKWADDKPAQSFKHFAKFLPNVAQVQLVKQLNRTKTYPDGLRIYPVIEWLKEVKLTTPAVE